MRAAKYCTYTYIFLAQLSTQKDETDDSFNVCKQVYDHHHNNNNTAVNSDTGNRIRKQIRGFHKVLRSEPLVLPWNPESRGTFSKPKTYRCS